jgi:FMN phosphatase YigB (HAD superfamily)
VGDSWPTDIEGARAAGMRALWFNRHLPPRNDEAVPELDAWDPVAARAELLVRLADGG